eukprot:8328799-Alexandrium_andersonii.AAC.1
MGDPVASAADEPKAPTLNSSPPQDLVEHGLHVDHGVEDATLAGRASKAVIDGGRDHPAELAQLTEDIALQGAEAARVVHSEAVLQAVHLLQLLAE